MHNCKNYFTDGGDTLVIGGTLDIQNGGLAEAQADSEASTVAALKEDFNALLEKLRDAGIMKEE